MGGVHLPEGSGVSDDPILTVEYITSDKQWPRIESASPIEDGQAIGILLREFDGSISALRIGVEVLAD